MIQTLGRMLLVLGAVLLAIGALLTLYDRIPFLGKLPGDIHVRKEGFEFTFPLTTGILLSLVITLLLWVIAQFRGK